MTDGEVLCNFARFERAHVSCIALGFLPSCFESAFHLRQIHAQMREHAVVNIAFDKACSFASADTGDDRSNGTG